MISSKLEYVVKFDYIVAIKDCHKQSMVSTYGKQNERLDRRRNFFLGTDPMKAQKRASKAPMREFSILNSDAF